MYVLPIEILFISLLYDITLHHNTLRNNSVQSSKLMFLFVSVQCSKNKMHFFLPKRIGFFMAV